MCNEFKPGDKVRVKKEFRNAFFDKGSNPIGVIHSIKAEIDYQDFGGRHFLDIDKIEKVKPQLKLYILAEVDYPENQTRIYICAESKKQAREIACVHMPSLKKYFSSQKKYTCNLLGVANKNISKGVIQSVLGW